MTMSDNRTSLSNIGFIQIIISSYLYKKYNNKIDRKSRSLKDSNKSIERRLEKKV